MDQSEFIHKVMTLASNVGHEAEENTIGEKSSSSSSSSYQRDHCLQKKLCHALNRDDQQGGGSGGFEEAQGKHLGFGH